MLEQQRWHQVFEVQIRGWHLVETHGTVEVPPLWQVLVLWLQPWHLVLRLALHLVWLLL